MFIHEHRAACLRHLHRYTSRRECSFLNTHYALPGATPISSTLADAPPASEPARVGGMGEAPLSVAVQFDRNGKAHNGGCSSRYCRCRRVNPLRNVNPGVRVGWLILKREAEGAVHAKPCHRQLTAESHWFGMPTIRPRDLVSLVSYSRSRRSASTRLHLPDP